MDVLYISATPVYPSRSPEGAVLYHLAGELVGRRYIMDLLSFYRHPADLAAVPFYADRFRSVQLIAEPRRNVGQRFRRDERRLPTTPDDAWSPAMWMAIQHKIQSAHYDVIHLAGGVEVHEYLPLFNGIPKIIMPSRFHYHHLIAPMTLPSREQQRDFGAVQAAHNWIFQPYERVLVTTPAETAILSGIDAITAIRTLPIGVDTEYFAPTVHQPKTPALFFQGNFDYQVDVAAAVTLGRDIFPTVARTIKDCRLYIAGVNPPPDVAQLASDQVFILEGTLDARPFYELASLYVCPLPDYGGFRLDVLQAMAMQTPVIGTPDSIAGLTVETEREAIIRRTPLELAQAIIRLLTNAEKHQKLRQVASALVQEQYTWAKITDRYDALYRELVNQ